jgi:hypothetical protein
MDTTPETVIASLGGTAPRIRVVADGRLPKKHKHRLPRLEKKALKARKARAEKKSPARQA